MADIAEQICLAVDQIVSQRLKSINYDTTIIATIIDNSNAKDNRYVCSTGEAQFVAFSKDTTFKINESVQVTIPNNDYDQQKIIVGRYVVKDSTPYVFTQPFDTIVDVSTNLISGNEDIIQGSLLANNEYDQADFNESSKKYDITIKDMLLWSKVFDEGYIGFNRLGLQGQFRSWMSSLKPVSGNYGYKLEILSSNGELTENNGPYVKWVKIYSNIINRVEYDINKKDGKEDPLWTNTPAEWFEKVKKALNLTSDNVKEDFQNSFYSLDKFSEERKNMVYALLYYNAQISEVYLDSSEMYGNPFNFQSFFEQEKVYDISSLKTIFGMNLYFYEKSGTFFNENRDYIPYKAPLGGKLLPNLTTKDPYVCLGYDLSDFNTEQAILYTMDGDSYKVKDNVASIYNRKHIRLRWLHKYEDGQIKVISEDSDLTGYEIRWYRYKMGSPSADEYSGVYWERVQKDNLQSFSYSLDPAYNVEKEQIKAIVLFEGKVIVSNILVFTSEIDVASSATTEILAGLSIWCLDKSYGNYFRYGQDNNLMDSVDYISDEDGNKQGKRITADAVYTFEARFADSKLLVSEYDIDEVAPKLTEAKAIIWEFPLNNSMIIVQGFDYNKKAPLEGFYKDATVEVKGNSIYIKRLGSPNGDSINSHQDYRINKTYNASKLNNTVKCTVHKNGLVYTASKELSFGLMGTNGTDATVVIDFDNNKTALIANEKNETLKVTAHLYDSSHNEVDFNNLDLNLSCQWSWQYYQVNSGENITLSQRYTWGADGNKILADESIEINTCHISHVNTLSLSPNKLKTFLILQATIYGYGDYALTSFKAIPIKATSQYCNIIGPTDVIYGTSGYPTYYKEPFQLWAYPSSESNNEDTITEVDTYWELYNPLKENENYIGKIEKDILKPASIYTSNAKPYGAIGKDLKTNTILWVQPFVIMQNEYPSTTLNKWDGKTVELNEEEGYIISPAIAAGKKNDDNTFSGVMLGDWSFDNISPELSKQTGVYGFHHGAVSFAFKEDGTAFIGKSGRGRILFNGNSGTIQSGIYEKNKQGMQIDLDGDGEDTKNSPSAALRAYGSGGAFELNTAGGDSTPLLVIKDGSASNSKKLFYIGGKEGSNREFYLQSSNYVKNSDGTKLDLASGKIEIYNSNGSGTSASWIKIDGDGDPYLEIHDGINNINIFHASIEKFYLQSSNYQHNVDGTKIDLNNGRIEIYNKGDNGSSFIRIDGSGKPYFQINNGEKNIFYASDNGYYLQSANYQSGVDGTKLDLDDGRLYMYSAEDGTSITIRGDGSPFLKIEDNGTNIFYASKGQYYLQSKDYVSGASGIRIDLDDGSIDARYGYIGGWKIGQYTLTGGSGNSTIELNAQYGYLLGGELRSTTGEIFLNGYFTVGSRGSNMRFGYYSSNTGTEADLTSQGIGMSVEGVSKITTTSNNVGLAFVNGGHISIDSSKLTINHNTKIIFGSSGASLECEIPAENQYGIYARFA